MGLTKVEPGLLVSTCNVRKREVGAGPSYFECERGQLHQHGERSIDLFLISYQKHMKEQHSYFFISNVYAGKNNFIYIAVLQIDLLTK